LGDLHVSSVIFASLSFALLSVSAFLVSRGDIGVAARH
jgi:hypothetical protein